MNSERGRLYKVKDQEEYKAVIRLLQGLGYTEMIWRCSPPSETEYEKVRTKEDIGHVMIFVFLKKVLQRSNTSISNIWKNCGLQADRDVALIDMESILKIPDVLNRGIRHYAHRRLKVIVEVDNEIKKYSSIKQFIRVNKLYSFEQKIYHAAHKGGTWGKFKIRIDD